ncbi:MAG: Ribonuclease HII [Candidatus Yanofskybacteria bacterium GW2011_GWD2_39_48]|uniref:Ribonuclease HII n=1 Tax=Candidatus Yanofskybacteria bacterium GW2011_GWD2_39_48 TaxID=1619031 RepID=A0A0G0P648_9BACT|nr:MAG: Ribonuclease HII [Candidatus Yanofskybacteria bacterium GW2011_GWD2_39_48]
MLPNKNTESKYIKSGYGQVIGVDEVGMGCLAGPVVVCAAYFDKLFYLGKSKNLENVNDSKLLSAKRREVIVEELIKIKYFKYKISFCQPKTIDRLNIHKASKLAMKRAVSGLARGTRAMVLVDGLHEIPSLKIKQRTITKGDSKVFVIACASIMAKVYRDKLMAKYAKKYPKYGFEIHKGYGTKQHYAQLMSIGPCAIHRKSFRLL